MPRDDTETQAHRRIVIEPNLEDLPWCVFGSSRQGRDGVIQHHWTGEYCDKGEIRKTEHYWEVRESKGLGLPGKVEQDVYVALLEFMERSDGMPTDGVVEFSLYEVLEILGWTHGGSSYELLRRALRCISSTSIDSRRAFYSPRLARRVSDNFNLFSVHFSVVDDYARGRLQDRSRLVWHPHIVDSYRNTYSGRLDTAFYWSLDFPLARRLYRLLDRRAPERREGGSRTWESDLLDLRDLIPLSDYKYVNHIKRVIEKPHNELTEKGFLSSVGYRETKVGRTKQVVVRYRLSSSFKKRSFSQTTDLSEAQADAVRQLQDIRLRTSVAEELVVLHGPQHCLYWLDLLHYQDGIDWKKAPGLLVNAIRQEPERWEEVARRKGLKSNHGSSPGGTGSGDVNMGDENTVDGVPSSGPDASQENAGDYTGDSGDDSPVEAVAEPDPAASDLWDKVIQGVAEETNAPSLRVWFEGTYATGLDCETLTIRVPNEFAKEYIESRFLEALTKSLRTHLSPTSEFEILVSSDRNSHNTNGSWTL